MIKYILSFYLLASCIISAWSQSLSVTISADSTEIRCALGGKSAMPVTLTNETSQAITVRVEKVSEHLSPYQSAFFVFGEKTTPARNSTSVNTYTLAPHHAEQAFTAYFSAGFKDNYASVKYRFINIYDSKEVASITFKYHISEELSEDLLYVSHDINISRMHPNPVNSYGEFDYRLATDHHTTARILIYNVLGKEVGSYPLQANEHRLFMRFNGWKPGVYFYTLVIGDKSVATKKFVLKY